MLLRAGLVYILSVLTVLLGGLAAWQHLGIALRDESSAVLSKRITALQNDLDAAGRREEAALRRARVAEDSLSRNATFSSSDAMKLNEAREELAIAVRDKAAAEVARSRLEADLVQAVKDRDQVLAEQDRLEEDAKAARIAAGKALEEAVTARQALADSKKAAAAVTSGATPAAVPQTSAVTTEAAITTPVPPVLEVQPPAVAAAADEPIRPASEAASTGNGDQRSTLVPNAVTIEPAAPKAENPSAAKRADVKSDPRRSKPKSAAASTSAAKKPPKQAKKDDPFFPF